MPIHRIPPRPRELFESRASTRRRWQNNLGRRRPALSAPTDQPIVIASFGHPYSELPGHQSTRVKHDGDLSERFADICNYKNFSRHI